MPPLECMFFTSPLSSGSSRKANSKSRTDEYSALSYRERINEPEDNITIYQDTGGSGERQSMTGFNRHRVFSVHENLTRALEALHSEIMDINIWVDALCINLEDEDETAAQRHACMRYTIRLLWCVFGLELVRVR